MNKNKFCYVCNAHYHHFRNVCVKCNRADTHRIPLLCKIAFFSIVVVAELYFFEVIKM